MLGPTFWRKWLQGRDIQPFAPGHSLGTYLKQVPWWTRVSTGADQPQSAKGAIRRWLDTPCDRYGRALPQQDRVVRPRPSSAAKSPITPPSPGVPKGGTVPAGARLDWPPGSGPATPPPVSPPRVSPTPPVSLLKNRSGQTPE